LSRAPRTIRNQLGVSPELSALEEILATAERRGLRVDLVLYPYHATQLLLFDDVGLWDAFASWKAELAATGHRYPGVTISDFAVIDDATRQPIPAPEDRPGRSPWYWEGGHFKRELGDRVLRAIMACAGQQDCPNRLPAVGPSLESHLARQHSLLEEYRVAMHQTDAARLLAPLGFVPR
jgi:hypothetical protein